LGLGITKFTQKVELWATKSKLIYFLMSVYYRMMVKREVTLANVSQNDRVLCIGGGVCPYTAILINKYTRSKVTVIDNDNACIEKSRKFLRRLGLDGIEIVHADGKHVCCRDYTVIHIAMQITPKELIIDEVLKKAKEGTRVLVRQPKSVLENLYCPLYGESGVFCSCVKHSLFSNVDNTSVCIVSRCQNGSIGSKVAV
jgi:16S rRNA A1518/A1519 N6-dimethyltransferase RsmA/KsgA/DIM1 with predicted DNA glycosylase/AP lyase activity